MEIRSARFPDDADLVRTLFREYADWLGVDLSFQGFEEELASLPGTYAAPGGELLLAADDGDTLGCVAFRPFEGPTCEMKRLWVRPRARRAGLATALVGELERRAAAVGYRSIVLDTLRTMTPALALYLRLGYREIEAYYHNPLPGAVYLAKDIGPSP
ncbi:MAG: GNAT family N-acetyltransferase [Spirochaetota bacterium]